VLISRRNQSLTSEMVEQTVLDQIAAMNIQDEVQAMIGDALDRFSASGAIADMIENEVADQIDALDIAGQIRSEIDRQIAAGNFVNAATLTTQVDRLDARITALSDGQLSLDQITLALQSRYGLTEGDILGIDRDTSITGALNVSELLTANGGLRVDGSVQFSSLVNCPVIGTDDTGTLVCKAGGIDQAASDARYLSRAGGTLTGALTIDSAETDGAQNLIVLKSDVNKTDNTVFRVTATGGVYTNEAFHSAGADYAEWFFSTTPDMQKGDLVCIDTTRDNAVRKCDREADSDLMGIISTYPAFIGNSIGGAGGALGITPPGYVLVGLIGQVPAFVTGDVRPGDSLTASAIPGVARKANAGESTVGVALESHSGDGIGKVRVLISRRNQSLTVETVEDHVLDTIKAMAIEDEVEQMITKTMEDVNFNGAVTDEVLTQIEELQIQEQLTLVLDELSTLKEQVHAAAQTGSIAAVTSAHVSAENATLSGALTAESIESRTTMAIGSDLRVGGNVYLEGTLITGQLYVPNGLTVEGGFDLRGALSTTDLTVSSGATISGALVLQGDLTMASGSTLMLGSGAVTINNDGIQAQNLLVRDALVVLGNITISGLAQFLGNVEVHGQLIVSSRQAGFAEVQPGQMSVTVSFGTGFTAQPVVTASPDVPVLYAVSKASMTGFTIRLAEPAKELITFSWLSLGTIAIETTESDSDQAIPFPVDEKGVPVSTNLIWNQCIRGYTPLDESGQPFNCSRYRVGDGHTWLHPDLNIEFDWLTNLDTPELRLPENYFAQWQIGSSSSTSSISNSSESSVASESSSESSSSEAVSSSESSSFSESSESSASSESSNSEPIHEAPPAEEPLGPLEQEEVIEEILEVIEGQ
jgi:cytoskeletal protein CcmA (bactofilin family)